MARSRLGSAASRAADQITVGEVPTYAVARPSNVISLTTNTAPTLAQLNGAVVVSTGGGYTLQLPSITGTNSTVPCVFQIVKNDTSAANGDVLISTAGGSGETFDNGLITIRLYNENYTVISLGGKWYTIGRARGWITLQKTTALVSGSSGTVTVLNGFADTELDEIEISADGLATATATTLTANLFKASSLVNSGYFTSVTYNSSTTATTAVGNAANTIIPLLPVAAASGMSFKINFKGHRSTAVVDQTIAWMGNLTGVVVGTNVEGTVSQSTAAAITSFRGQLASGAVFTAGQYRARGYRA